MRKEFSQYIEKAAIENEKIVFLTGDLGFMALENVQKAIGDRFINVGVSEQNMVSMAASLAYEGMLPICYSIAPFIVYRPAEQIRLDVCLHNLNVKIVGNGGGFGYGIMGATHHAIEDIAVLGSFQNMECFIPFCNEDVAGAIDAMLDRCGPSYLRLGYGIKPESVLTIPNFNAIRRLLTGTGVTIIGSGPVLINIFEALDKFGKNLADVFVVSKLPLFELSQELKESIKKTKKVLIIEEHVRHGGLGENIASLLLEEGIFSRYSHLFVRGYITGLYGNRDYHIKENDLDISAIGDIINSLLRADISYE